MPQPSIEAYNNALDALQAGKAPEALAAIVESLTEDPNDTQSWQLYIVILNALGRTDDAERAIAKLKEKGLSPADELLLKAAAAASAGDVPGALPHYESALGLEPQRVDIHASHALALMQCDQPQAALAAAEKAVELDPEDAHAQYALGHILRLTDQKEAALEALSRSVASDPEFMIALYEQGMLLAENGRLNEALGNFERFLAAHPDDRSASQAVATLKQRLASQS